jgi:hypothetical protein
VQGWVNNKLLDILADVSVEDHILVVMVVYSFVHLHGLRGFVHLQVTLYAWE